MGTEVQRMVGKLGRRPNRPEDKLWFNNAKTVLKGEMLRQGVSTSELSRRLATIGFEIDPNGLSKKIGKGGFTFAFFLQCMNVMGVESLDLYLARDPKPIVIKSSGEPLDGKPLKLIDEDEPPTG